MYGVLVHTTVQYNLSFIKYCTSVLYCKAVKLAKGVCALPRLDFRYRAIDLKNLF